MLLIIVISLAFLSLAWTSGCLLGLAIYWVLGEERMARWIGGK